MYKVEQGVNNAKHISKEAEHDLKLPENQNVWPY